MVINIREARRAGARTVTAFAGVSGSGKTYSAIQFAYGLAGYDAAKVGLLDTENRRGSLYADILQRATKPARLPFKIADLSAPFSPDRYRKAILEFQDAGVDVLVIDSVTHEWEGFGGCDDIANDGDPKFPRWNKAKREHRGFVNTMLQCDMHIVACVRAREKVKVEDGGKKITPLGIMPVCEKNFMFEMTASVLLHDEGTRYDRLKVPSDLKAIFPGDKYITADTGYAVLQWVEGGGIVDPKVEKYRNRLLSVAEQGVRYIETAWAKVPADVQRALGDSFYAELEASAGEFDSQRAVAEAPETMTSINNELAAKAQPPHLDFN